MMNYFNRLLLNIGIFQYPPPSENEFDFVTHEWVIFWGKMPMAIPTNIPPISLVVYDGVIFLGTLVLAIYFMLKWTRAYNLETVRSKKEWIE